ncbi:MAG TPA: hypothetical protein VEH28_07670 [Thermoplasmata archaeon]|nr:hypothetical protein [Thermoplasmata archaeon]
MPGPVNEWRGRGEACVLAWVGGVLFLVEGFYLLVHTAIALPFGSVDLPSAGAVSAAAGLSLIFLAAFYRSYGEYRSYFGTLIVLISAGDVWFGGGFWVGSILGTIAGVLILALPPYGLRHQPP